MLRKLSCQRLRFVLLVIFQLKCCISEDSANNKIIGTCNLKALPPYTGVTCTIADDLIRIPVNSVVQDTTFCSFKCLNGYNAWGHCQGSKWNLNVDNCKQTTNDEEEDYHTPLVHVRHKRWIRFRRIFRTIKCWFSRCRKPRPRDRNPPSLHCPPSVTQLADKFQTSTKVSWTVPTAYDDRDGSVSVHSTTNNFPGQLFGEGRTRVGYYASDKSGNRRTCFFDITVTVTRCPKVKRVENGYVICHPSVDMRRGGICRYGCYRGHKLQGVSRSECSDAGRWTGWTLIQPYCEKMTCPSFISSGMPSISCSDSNRFRSVCTYFCPDGYDIPRGEKRARICQHDGTWSGGDVQCQDIQPPRFANCPASYTFYAPKYKETATVFWNVPDVVDNSAATIQAVQSDGPVSTIVLPVGSYTVKYSAKDQMGNEARECQFEVIVKQIRCFSLYATPYTHITCTGNRYGSTCKFKCSNDAELNGKHTVFCDRQGEPPYGSWNWEERQPFCKLTQKCPYPAPPDHGVLACDVWRGGRFCQMQCQDGYDVPGSFPGMMVCHDGGQWDSNNAIKACKKASSSKQAKTKIKIYYRYFTGSCEDENTQIQIKQNFIETFKTSNFGHLCLEDKTCSWQNVKVFCGTSRRKRYAHRAERSASGLGIHLEVVYEADELNEDSYNQIYNNHAKQMENLQNDINNGSLDLSMDNKTIQPSEMEVDGLNLVCENNSVASFTTFSCVECSSGSFYDESKMDCVDCPRGTYQPVAGQRECLACPPQTSTASTGTQNIGQCLDACPPGSWSDNSLFPCTECDVGSYQDKYGATSCIQCRGGQTTISVHSTSISQCQEFDIAFPENQTIGIVLNPNDLILDTFTLSLRFQCPAKCKGTIMKMTRNSPVLELEMQEQIIVSAFGNSYSATDLPPKDNRWHSLSISHIDFTFQVEMDMKVVLSTSIPQGVANVTAISFGESFVGAISQINIFSNKTHHSKVKELLQRCFNEENGDVISWRDFKDANLNNAYVQIPSQCDDFNECYSSPCLNGTCIDKLLNYTCLCDGGFTGRMCDINIDDCIGNSCLNNATCIDLVSNYTCQCQSNFTGEFCEIEQVDGEWGDWGNWLDCSVTCGNGSMSRSRVCDSPAPDNGGLECQGNDTDYDDCYKEECRVCTNLTEPDHAILNCTETELMKVCTLMCEDGYEFDHTPPDLYTCGNETAYFWDFKTEGNVDTKLSSCSATADAEKMSIVHTVSYESLECSEDTHDDILRDLMINVVNNLTCIKTKMCIKNSISVTNCNPSRKKRDNSAAGFNVVLQCSPKTFGTETCYEVLNIAASELQTFAADGLLTVTLEGIIYLIDTNSTFFNDELVCSIGTVSVFAYCVPCAPGRYFIKDECRLCGYGYYQDEFQQTCCKSCPKDLTTAGTGSTNITDCNVPDLKDVIQATRNTNDISYILLGVCIGSMVILIAVILRILRVIYKSKGTKPKIGTSLSNIQSRRPDKNLETRWGRERCGQGALRVYQLGTKCIETGPKFAWDNYIYDRDNSDVSVISQTPVILEEKPQSDIDLYICDLD